MAIQIDFLKTAPYFSGLNSAELDSIQKFVFEKRAERGQILIFEGEPAEALYLVVSGVVKIFKTSSDGKEQILYLVRPGESFNEVPVFDEGPALSSAEAMGPVLLYGLRKNDLKGFFEGHPRAGMNMMQILSQRVQQLVSLVEDLSFKPVTKRVAKILLEHAGDGTGQSMKLTQQEMAAMAGTAREMVGRSLKVLEDEGTIRFDRHRIIITDKEALKEMAE